MAKTMMGLMCLMMVSLAILTDAGVEVQNKAITNIKVYDRDTNLQFDPLQPDQSTTFPLNAAKDSDSFEFSSAGTIFANAEIADNSKVVVTNDRSGVLSIKVTKDSGAVQNLQSVFHLLAMVAGGFLAVTYMF